MIELKPFPFCGSCEERPINHAEDCFIRMYAENVDEYYYSETLVHDRESMKEAWNTRAERTCVLEDIPYEPGCWEGVRCSSCGVTDEDTDLTGNYCPRCGAKVERGES